jgi:hypothetical protein
LYVSNNRAEKEIIKAFPLMIAKKIKTKHQGINLAKEMKELYHENYKTLMKETEEDKKERKALQCARIGRINS